MRENERENAQYGLRRKATCSVLIGGSVAYPVGMAPDSGLMDDVVLASTDCDNQ